MAGDADGAAEAEADGAAEADGFADARLLVTQGKSTPSLFRRVAVANQLQADLLLSAGRPALGLKVWPPSRLATLRRSVERSNASAKRR